MKYKVGNYVKHIKQNKIYIIREVTKDTIWVVDAINRGEYVRGYIISDGYTRKDLKLLSKKDVMVEML
jgi:hypothetical protein